jgi:hypothetical protein
MFMLMDIYRSTNNRQLHQAGNEEAWWAARNIGALAIAKDLWAQTRIKVASVILGETPS